MTLSDSLSPGESLITLRTVVVFVFKGPDSSAHRLIHNIAPYESFQWFIRAAAHFVGRVGVSTLWAISVRLATLDHVRVGSFAVGTEALACDRVFSLSGSPDPIMIVAAAGALGAVVFNLLNSAETGTNIGAMLDGFVESGVVDACGIFRGFPPDRAVAFLDEFINLYISAAAHFVFFGISGVLA